MSNLIDQGSLARMCEGRLGELTGEHGRVMRERERLAGEIATREDALKDCDRRLFELQGRIGEIQQFKASVVNAKPLSQEQPDSTAN
ncbi:MAG: hypothetical protein ACRD9R_03960 [Pyrinomonadaceae bacterium]